MYGWANVHVWCVHVKEMGEKFFSLHFYYPIKQGGGGGGGIGDKYGCVTCVRDVLEKNREILHYEKK